jgi:hypothetical protein
MKSGKWDRWSPLGGLLAVVCWFVAAFPLLSNSPNTTASNAKILHYYASHSNQIRQIVAVFVFIAGTMLFLVFLSGLRNRMAAVEGPPWRAATLAFGSGVVTNLLVLTGFIAIATPAIAVNDTSKFRLDPNAFRLFNDLGFPLIVAGVIVAALLVWATSLVALRSRMLPKWFAWLGVIVGILMLFSYFFIPILIFWAWLLIASLILFFRETPAQAADAQTSTPSA